jgi:hypothetical protein
MKKEVAVLLVPLGGEPVVRLIPSDVESSYKMLRGFVGGSISSQVIAPRLQLIANENGLYLRLPYNRCGYVGTFLIAKYSAAGNNLTMTEKDVATALEWLTRNDHYPPLCHVCGKPGGVTMFCRCRDVLIYCVDCYDRAAQVMNGSSTKEKERFALCHRCRTTI